MKVVDNEILHFEHRQWLGEIDFWCDEIKTFQSRIKEIEHKWTNPDVLAELGQYINQFQYNLEKINQLKKEINEHEHVIAKQYAANKNAIDRVYMKRHINFRDRFDIRKTIYNELKRRFFLFLSHHL